jgi:uncharacterized membrane-anchored protein
MNVRHGHGPVRVILLLILLLLGVSLQPRAALADDSAKALYRSIHWIDGPAVVDLAGIAKLQVPPGYRFTDAAGARIWNQLTENPPSDDIGILTPPIDVLADKSKTFFLIFNYDDVGYVKDDETLDNSTIDQILQQIRDATIKGNQERTAHGWPTLTINGWAQRPFYEPTSHHLTWAIDASDNSGDGVVNYQSRALGRRGVLRTTMVLAPNLVAANTPLYTSIVSGITFNPGDTYEEYRVGDKVAKYGLIGLISGGAAVAAIKLWKPLMAFGAFIVAGIGSAFRKIKRMFTRNSN